jgi:hypothetical protein
LTGSRTENLIGKRFGRLTVLESAGKYAEQYAQWKCQCDCGIIKVILANKLKGGETQSCGCLQKERCSAATRGEPGQAAATNVHNRYRRQAKIRGVSFELSKPQFLQLTRQDCYYCGALPSQHGKSKRKNGEYLYNGIDRVNNNIGYTVDNCVACCGECNSMKSSQSKEVFLRNIKNIYLRHYND